MTPHPALSALSLDAVAHAAVARAFALRPLRNFIAVDATLGNGFDAVFLGGLAEMILAFDIQPRALESASARLAEAGLSDRVNLILDGHENLASHIPSNAQIGAAMFNLGFLPGSDRKIITRPQTTLTALAEIISRLAPGGVVSLHVYAGHRGGEEEKQAVLDFTQNLPPDCFRILRCDLSHKKFNREILILLENIL